MGSDELGLARISFLIASCQAKNQKNGLHFFNMIKLLIQNPLLLSSLAEARLDRPLQPSYFYAVCNPSKSMNFFNIKNTLCSESSENDSEKSSTVLHGRGLVGRGTAPTL